MAATVAIAEFNTAGETKTASITNTNMGDTDAVNLDPVAYPVTPGNYTYEKWQKIEVTAMGVLHLLIISRFGEQVLWVDPLLI